MSGEVVRRFCTLCGSAFEQELKQGRPRTLCPSCAAPEKEAERVKAKRRAYYQREDVKAKRRAYYQREDVKAKQRAYYQREDVKAKQRAYRQREDVKAKRRAYCQREDVKAKRRARRAAIIIGDAVVPRSRWQCSECGEQLRRQTEDGLCGFCRQGIPA